MKWQDDSEVVAGLVLTNRLSATSVRPEIFFGEYQNLIKLIKQGVVEPEELTSRIGLGPVQAAIEASKSVNGLGTMDWPRILETSYANYSAGTQMEKLGKKLQQGDDIDWAMINKISSKAQEGIGGDFVPLSEVKGGKVPFIPSGWKVFDEHIGGIPKVGPIIVGGNPGVGKTTFMTQFAMSFAKQHPEKKVAIFSLEMILDEIAMRFREVYKVDKSVEERILLNDHQVTPEQVVNKASTIDNLGIIFVDFIDYMVAGEASESAYSHIYKTFAIGSKELACPTFLLAQLNRYKGGIPKPYHLRYTGLAEAFAWMILMLYNKNTDWHEKEEEGDHTLPSSEDTAFVIAWKIRGGFRKHINDAPGAIMIPFKGNRGWHPTKGRWFSLKRL